MSKAEIMNLLKEKGYGKIVEKQGGIEILVEKRIPLYEFNYYEFLRLFVGRMDEKKIHFLDPWTFTIECE